MNRVAAIALGSNLSSPWGDREANLRKALARIAHLGTVHAVSSFYDTAPVGITGQPRFVNGAMLLETELEPLTLLHGLLAIEHEMGRDRAAVPAKGPRVIDLDLLLMGDVILTTLELTLPHPEMSQRRFVLQPLAEIAPSMRHPISGHTVRDLLNALADRA